MVPLIACDCASAGVAAVRSSRSARQRAGLRMVSMCWGLALAEYTMPVRVLRVHRVIKELKELKVLKVRLCQVHAGTRT
jgi:uncharacterized protein (DUF486 family)